MKVFNYWAALRGEVRPIYLLSPIDLTKVLQSFYAEVKKKKMATSISQIPERYIERCLKENNYHVSIIRESIFNI